MDFSFPEPKLGKIKRPVGQGCKSCVHKFYCSSFYWFRRYGERLSEVDDHLGIQCASWSSNLADQIKTEPNERDLEEMDYIYIHGTGSEPDRNGTTESPSGAVH